MVQRTLWPEGQFHTSPFYHYEMHDYYESPERTVESYLSINRYQAPSRHGVRFYKVNLSTGSLTEIISSGYNLYYSRAGDETGWLLGNFNVTVPDTITFAPNEGFGLQVWAALEREDGTWAYSPMHYVEVLYVNGNMQPIDKINPCTFTMFILSYRTTTETPANTYAYSEACTYGISQTAQTRVYQIDIDYAIIAVVKKPRGDGLTWAI